jgi:hypothetical protein
MKRQFHLTLIIRYKLAKRIRTISILLVLIGCTSIALGWVNLYRTIFIGADARVPMLDLAGEQVALLNILQPILMCYAAYLCFVALRLADTSVNRTAFPALSVGFLILAAGEINISSHSTYIEGAASLLGTTNPVAMMLPLFLVPIGSALFLRRFLIQLPLRHSVKFMAFGVIYVAGVLGAETVWQSIVLWYGDNFAGYTIAAGIEETLETVGILGFCVAMYWYIQEVCPKVFLEPRI